MTSLTVSVGDRSYDVLFGRGLIARAGELARATVKEPGRAVIVTDKNVAPLWLDGVCGSFATAGFAVATVVLEPGEEHKQLSAVKDIYAGFAESGLTRDDLCVALGGGVVGDVAGFAAATWLRGIRLVQIPTTLLAQVDSSVGGKTGVDLPMGKNLVGSFHQPSLVLIDPDVLATLPQPWPADGFAEMIKAGCILDAAFFATLAAGDVDTEAAVLRAVDIKRRLVEQDETDRGCRKLLNFGHTVGHALEAAGQYRTFTHGQAVAIGMAAVTRSSERRGLTAPGTAARLEAALAAYGLPTAADVPLVDLLPLMLHDKKCHGGDIDLVILKSIGHAAVYTLAADELGTFLEGSL